MAVELYALPPAGFVEARDELVGQLRGVDRSLAALVKGWGRPTAAAWAVNALARGHAAELEPLLAVGAQMREAQDQLDGPTLRGLQTQVQQVLRGLLQTARRAAGEAGVTLGTAPGEQVLSTLRAAMADPGAAEAVRSARLMRALEHTGFGEVDVHEAVAATGGRATPGVRATRPAGGRTAPPARALRSVRPASGPEPEPERAERERAERERSERERAERERRRAALDEAVGVAAEAQEELHDREDDLEDAERRHREAETAVADLTRRLDQARTELETSGGDRQHAIRSRDRAARAADRAAAAEQRAREAWEELRPLRVVADD